MASPYAFQFPIAHAGAFATPQAGAYATPQAGSYATPQAGAFRTPQMGTFGGTAYVPQVNDPEAFLEYMNSKYGSGTWSPANALSF